MIFLEVISQTDNLFINECSKYKISPQNINLVIWLDGASFKKTGSKGAVWSIMAMIFDLGPKLRNRLENFITIFHIGILNIFV